MYLGLAVVFFFVFCLFVRLFGVFLGGGGWWLCLCNVFGNSVFMNLTRGKIMQRFGNSD